MKKFTTIIMCMVTIYMLILTIPVYAEQREYGINDEARVRLLGRGEPYGEGRTFNWSNSGVEFEFTGTKAEIYVSDIKTVDETDYNRIFFNISVDDSITPVRVALQPGWNTLYESEKTESHKIKFVRSSDAQLGTCTFSKIRINGSSISATSEKKRKIEFIGDSYTTGFANSPQLSDSESYCAENTDNWYSFTGIVSRAYDADCNVIAYPGRGVYINYDKTQTGTMSQQFMYSDIWIDKNTVNMSTRSNWDFENYSPDITVVFLGTNDWAYTYNNGKNFDEVGKNVRQAYVKLLDTIREKYPYTSIIAVSKQSNCYGNEVTDAVDICGGEKNRIYRLILDEWTDQNKIFAGHPTRELDTEIAEQIISKIDSTRNIWNRPNDDVAQNNSRILLLADYNSNEVTVRGNMENVNDDISIAVTKPNRNLEEAVKDSSAVAYVNQVVTDGNGDYSVSFHTDVMAGEYTLNMNSIFFENMLSRTFKFRSYIPKLEITRDGQKITKMCELNSGDTIDVTVSGFDMYDDGVVRNIFVAQYSNGVLVDVDMKNASNNTTAYGEQVVFGSTIQKNVDKVKVMYIETSTLIPVIGSFTIE